ncbi:mechanosensitive ion channel family protein [Dokdonia donghaensis]|uniref:Mechanosensing system component YbdG n=1 Tax=Dokdonia donghaensis DSW-1 TaxID=1300343 RepID=A0A0A2GV70_9FLAO|nr:mechanosensitive ion channel domain-containing protein [Dokdonia donghaensis]ANH59815.1 Miniconductance mechanosensitive channel YbdG [Dokdonia donghaensis DSW-1]KGO07147.1 mechanosensitive ion channel protein MscS [Dokdonia donghaensis DSW-1]
MDYKKEISCFFFDYFIDWGLSETFSKYLNAFVLGVIVLVLVFLADMLVRKVLRNLAAYISKSSKTNFDDLLIKNRVPRRLAHILPLYLLIGALPFVLDDFLELQHVFSVILNLIGIILALRIIRALLHTLRDYFKTIPGLRDKPIDSYIQVFMIFAWVFTIFYAISLITPVSLGQALGTFGAASAIILLIFKDTILGFVASIQVAINDMVRIGDWITFEKYGADGDVVEINLATVKVQNFDMTITTIPTYALISDSFKNWRGMTDSPGRRIKRSLYIKQDSIKFLTDEDIQRFKRIGLITDYLTNMEEKLARINERDDSDKSIQINGSNLTNVGLFRKYMETYIQNHSAIHKEMLLMCRQLAPTPQGIPLEVYCFSKDKKWENYEYIIADLFDHFLAAVPYFDLELFEYPSSPNRDNFIDVSQ